MKGKAVMAGPALALMFLLVACDNIQGPLENSFAPPVPAAFKQAQPTVLTREEMEADYNFILSLRSTVREMGEGALASKDKGDMNKFGDQMAMFNYQYKNWVAMVNSRKSVIASTGESYPPGHPAALLTLAFNQLRQELDSYYRKINNLLESSPEADAHLMATMKEARAALDNLAPEAGGAPIPVK